MLTRTEQFKYMNFNRMGDVCMCISGPFNETAKFPRGTAASIFVQEKEAQIRSHVEDVIITVARYAMQWIVKQSLFDTATYDITDRDLLKVLGKIGEKMANVIKWEQRLYSTEEAVAFFDGSVSVFEREKPLTRLSRGIDSILKDDPSLPRIRVPSAFWSVDDVDKGNNGG